MYVRLTWGRLNPGTWDSFEEAYRHTVLEVSDSVPGLRGRMLVRDVENPDAGGTLSLWDSAEAAQAYEQGPRRQDSLPAIQPFFAGDYTVHVCEMRASSGQFDAVNVS